MSDKYIIRNCKALISNDICELYSQKGIHLSSYIYCKDKNCLLKQIVELCKKAPILDADWVLNKLDIQETE